MAYTDIYDAAVVVNSPLRKRLAVALHKAATDISVEDPQTLNHSQRVAWARKVFADPVGWADKTIWTILQNSTIAATPDTAPDNDVQFAVNSNITAFFNMV